MDAPLRTESSQQMEWTGKSVSMCCATFYNHVVTS